MPTSKHVNRDQTFHQPLLTGEMKRCSYCGGWSALYTHTIRHAGGGFSHVTRCLNCERTQQFYIGNDPRGNW